MAASLAARSSAAPRPSGTRRPPRSRGAVARRGLVDGRWVEESLVEEKLTEGREAFNAGDFSRALEVFEAALDPAVGAAPEERQSLLFNVACCHTALGDEPSAVLALRGAHAAGFGKDVGDFDALSTSPALKPLRESGALQALVDELGIRPTRLQRELDFGSSTIGRFAKKMGW